MTERPILFSAPMVRAIVEGKKTQTRRVMGPKMAVRVAGGCFECWSYPKRGGGYWIWPNAKPEILAACPYGVPGDRLWVRETWRTHGDRPLSECTSHEHVMHAASASETARTIFKFRPSIHMPRWASRISLELVDVRVQRLQDISEEDAWAEGIKGALTIPTGASRAFSQLWDGINAARGFGWSTNPWVWALTFKRI